MKILNSIFILLLIFNSCKPDQKNTTATAESVAVTDPLPSWNDGKIKSDIMAFVKKVTTAGSPDFVPEADRIATFDNDGTLWLKNPLLFNFYTPLMSSRRGLPTIRNGKPQSRLNQCSMMIWQVWPNQVRKGLPRF